MTRSEWKRLPESERERIRQQSAAQSLRRTDWERSQDFWLAYEAHKVQNAGVGLLVVMAAVMALPLLAALSIVVEALVAQLPPEIVQWFKSMPLL